jgi:orotidine-5'-phosphate decarboxylase
MLLQEAHKRLIVAADYKPIDNKGVESVLFQVESLCKELSRTNVCIKVNSLLRAEGYDLLEMIHSFGLTSFPDLKLNDIGETLAIDGEFLREVKPRFVTAMCSTGHDALKRLKDELPDTKVLGVTVLTTFTEEQCVQIYGTPIRQTVFRLAEMAALAGVDGFISSPKEAHLLKNAFPDKLVITPGVRFADVGVKGDDQNQDRVATPEAALQAGADCVVMGRPITQASDVSAAVLKFVDQISHL